MAHAGCRSACGHEPLQFIDAAQNLRLSDDRVSRVGFGQAGCSQREVVKLQLLDGLHLLLVRLVA